MLDLHSEGKLPESLDVSRSLRSRGSNLSSIDILELAHNASLSNFDEHCIELYDLFHRRNVQASAMKLLRDIETLSIDALQTGYQFRQQLDQLESGLPDRRAKALSDVAQQVLQEMNQQGHHLIRTGIKSFDAAFGGYEPGCLYVPAGRPSMGKSAFLCQQINGIAIEQQIPTGLLLLEGTDAAILRRLVTRYCGYSAEDIRQSRADVKQVSQALDFVSQAPLQIDDSPCSLDRLESRITRLVLNGAQIVFVDYLQRIRDHRPRVTTMETITAISGTLKDMAKQLHVPIIALSQLSREPDKRSNWEKRPIMSDLRGSGDLEQDADGIFFLFRPEYYQLSQYSNGASTANITEVHIAKNRDGAIRAGDDAVTLYHNLKYSAYYSNKGEFDNGEPAFVRQNDTSF